MRLALLVVSAVLSHSPESVGGEPPTKSDVIPRRAYTARSYPRSMRGKTRVRNAHEHKDAEVEALFGAVGLSLPPKQLHLRVFKEEMELEVWASDKRRGPVRHVTTYQICAASGVAGPKRKEGDLQVPEGFYELDMFNRYSSYHLSMRINYPNHRDRGLRSTGSAIMIHGDCASIGCLAMSDERIEELWVMATGLDKQRVTVHLFPGRDLQRFITESKDEDLSAFWRNLAQGKQAFERAFVVPRVTAHTRGLYRFSTAKPSASP